MSDFDLPITALGAKRHRELVTQLVNEKRVAAGRKPLKYAPSLRVSAQAWALVCTRNSRFDHGNFTKRVLRFPFILSGKPHSRRVGENLAMGTGGFSSPRSIVNDWMNSPRHRANILRKEFTYAAVWSAADSPEPGKQADGVTVVHHFGGKV
jgi:uncharacterized protein YkwD